MGRTRNGRQRIPSGPERRWVTLALIGGLLALGLGAAWLLSGTEGASAGMPRLAVDRTEIDLGRFAFETRARAVFTLTNAGTAPLRILDVSPVKALKGC